MMNYKATSFSYIVFVMFIGCFSACKTYFIPLDSFKQQTQGLNKTPLREVTTRGPIGEEVTYKTYPIDYIKCLDKHGNPYELKNSPSIEVRFTYGRNKKTVFYFDRIYVDDSSVMGSRSRILGMPKRIPLNSITEIEVQNGKKRYRYVGE